MTLWKMVNFQKKFSCQGEDRPLQVTGKVFSRDGYCKQNEEEWGVGDGAFSVCSWSNFLSLDPSPKLASTYSQKKKRSRVCPSRDLRGKILPPLPISHLSSSYKVTHAHRSCEGKGCVWRRACLSAFRLHGRGGDDI